MDKILFAHDKSKRTGFYQNVMLNDIPSPWSKHQYWARSNTEGAPSQFLSVMYSTVDIIVCRELVPPRGTVPIIKVHLDALDIGVER